MVAQVWTGDAAQLPLKPGMVGGFVAVTVWCHQAIDEKNFIGAIRDDSVAPGAVVIAANEREFRQTVWFKGYDTSEMQDRLPVTLEGVFVVTGTKKYANVAGSTTQLVVVEPFDVTPYYVELKRIGELPDVPAINAKKKAEPKPETAEEKTAREEKAAAAKMRSAEALLKAGKQEGYRNTLKELAEKYPATEAGKSAAKLLKK
jgi:hypothetical protein